MLTYIYYPFKNSLEILEAKDLIALREIAEGWYVDYKSQPLKTVDFAKHLAAFANQYGGFLFVGVKEADDGSKCAGTFSGIDDAGLINLSIQIREASSAHINPPVLYEEKIIKGPCEELGLPKNKSVVIIGIPKSVNTPHIHSSGRIYRRLADHSDPKPETDRHILDDLWKRGEAHRLQVSKFLSETPPLPESMSNSSWAYIYFRPDENQPKPSKQLTFDEFNEIVTNSNNKIQGAFAPMDAVYASPGGFTARQTKNNNPTLPTLTFRWWHDGTARLEIPLNKYSLKALLESKAKYKHAEEFCTLAYQLNFEQTTLVDYSWLLRATSGLANIHLHLSQKLEDNRDIFSCFVLKNISYTSPFLDTNQYLSRIKKFSLPLTVDNEIRQPFEPNQNNMFCHKFHGVADQPEEIAKQAKPLIFVAPLIFWILQSVGAIQKIEDWIDDSEMW